MLSIYISIFLLLLSACGLTPPESQTQKPNILYIFTDDQSIRTLGCYEGAQGFVETPNIDRLAEQGVRFKYAYTGAKCVPSRGNALTGRLQFNYDKSTRYWVSDLKEQGYHTGMIGKWHWNEPRYDETWDEAIIWEHHLKGYNNYYWNQKVRINNREEIVLDQYSTDYYTDRTIDFIQNRSKDPEKPWFYWLCFAGVHGPYHPDSVDVGAYSDKEKISYPIDVFGPRPDKPAHLYDMSMFKKDRKTGEPTHQGRSLDSWVKQYNECVRSIDRGIGKIMEALEATEQLENTVIIFTSDQGYAWGHHGYKLKIAPYEATLLAPLIFVHKDKIPENKVVDVPVNGTDIIATIQKLTDINPTNESSGDDFSKILYEDASINLEEHKLIQTYTGHIYGNEQMTNELKMAHETDNWERFICHPKTQTKAWMMLRKGKYKYVRYIYKDYIEELYDLENDPEELVNLAVRSNYKNTLLAYRLELLEEFEKKGATFLDLIPVPKEVAMN